jgi:phosphate uptake regulator
MTAVEQDDEVAHVHKSLHQERPEFVRRDPTLASQAIRLLTVGVALERMADHVANSPPGHADEAALPGIALRWQDLPLA